MYYESFITNLVCHFRFHGFTSEYLTNHRVLSFVVEEGDGTNQEEDVRTFTLTVFSPIDLLFCFVLSSNNHISYGYRYPHESSLTEFPHQF